MMTFESYRARHLLHVAW